MSDVDKITVGGVDYDIKDSGARTLLNTKVDIAQGSSGADKIVVTDNSGNISLTSEIPQSKITNLVTDLASKVPIREGTGLELGEDANGVYVWTTT